MDLYATLGICAALAGGSVITLLIWEDAALRVVARWAAGRRARESRSKRALRRGELSRLRELSDSIATRNFRAIDGEPPQSSYPPVDVELDYGAPLVEAETSPTLEPGGGEFGGAGASGDWSPDGPDVTDSCDSTSNDPCDDGSSSSGGSDS